MAECMMALRSAKNLLRKEIKQRVKMMSESEKVRQSSVVTKMLLETPEYRQSSRVSIFLSMSDEVKTLEILKHILQSDRKCYIPRYLGSAMDMVRLYSMEDYDSLPETAWKIKQPADDEVRENAIETGGLDLVLMPGLGFSLHGDRLGRGKGYYDTYLSRGLETCNDKVYITPGEWNAYHQPGCAQTFGCVPPTVALAYNEQICDSIPTTDLDVKLDKVLFENKDK